MKFNFLLLSAFVLVTACIKKESASTVKFTADDFSKVQPFLDKYCVKCHNQTDVEGGFGTAGNLGTLVSSPGLITPGKAEESALWKRVVKFKDMPPDFPKGNPIPSDAEREIITKWINAGAPTTFGGGNATPVTATSINPSQLYEAMRKDLSSLSANEQRVTRYLSLDTMLNTGSSADDIKGYASGLSKLVNSMSWKKTIIPLVVVPGTSNTLLRLNLSNYGTTANQVGLRHLSGDEEVGLGTRNWERLGTIDPYQIRYSGGTASTVRQLTGTVFPYIRGDFFAFKAGAAPEYYKIMGFGDSLQALESSLFKGPDTAARLLKRLPVIRSGFSNSGVSRHNRLMERHPIALYEGAYWLSYDFAGSIGRQQLTKFPVGPAGAISHQTQIFEYDGGEVIFNLPNGLQAYIIATSKGKLIDEAPTAIVSDPKRTVVTAAFSCMDCHVNGINKKGDEIRSAVESVKDIYSKEDLEFIRYAYPAVGSSVLDTAYETDSRRHKAADKASAIPGLSSNPRNEPVSDLVDRFVLDVSVVRAASETGLNKEEFLRGIRANDVLSRTFASFLAGSPMKRETFKNQFPSLISQLRLADTNVVSQSSTTQSVKAGAQTCLVNLVDPAGKVVHAIKEASQVSLSDCQSIAMRVCQNALKELSGYRCVIGE